MAMCPHIERVSINISDNQGKGETTQFTLLNYLLCNFETGSTFPNLRLLDIDTGDCKYFSLCDPRLLNLVDWAPHLKALILRGPEGERVSVGNSDLDIQRFCSAIRNITELQILGWSFYGESREYYALERILGAAKNLQSFKFVADNEAFWWISAPFITPSQLIECLNPRTRETLQHLSLNFDSEETWDLKHMPEPTIITPGQIKEFTNITTLTLDLSCYCRHMLGRQVGAVFEQQTCLVDFLPQTVQNLSILFSRWGEYKCLEDISYLGQRTVAGDFPKLKRVRVHARTRYATNWNDEWHINQVEMRYRELNERLDKVREAFAGSGVETEVRSWCTWVAL
ncbi:hypothetical protein IL306_008990 [Fusarium sp. DS 682]|nr:hypothetical protein IL306_008990 [Fusarium sp. DS 682]